MTEKIPKTFSTSRFGTIPVNEGSVLTFPEGLLGFPSGRRFLLLETAENGVFYWMQSLDDPALAFVVIDPELLVRDYRKGFSLSDWDRDFFSPADLSDPESMTVMAIVTFSEGPGEKATANLQGPLLVRESDRTGRQVVIPEADSWLLVPVFGQEKETPGSS